MRKHKNRWNPFTRLSIHFLAMLGLGLIALQCVKIPSAPVLPTLDVQGSIPLVDRRFTIADFAAKDPAFVHDANGGLIYTTSQAFEPIPLDTLSVQPEASSQQVPLGTFQVQTPSIPPISLPLPLSQGTFPVPPATFTVPAQSIGPLASFEYIEFESGTITLQIQNDFPVAVSFPNPLVMRNNQTSAPVDTALVASFTVPGPVAANSGTQTTYDLAGVRMLSGLLIPSITVSTPGSGGTPVSVTSSSKLQVQLTISNATVRAAKAKIPSQPILSFADSTFVVDDSVSLSTAFFKSGSFSVQIQNNVNVDVSVYLRFSELQDVNTSQPFQVNHTFNGVGAFNIPINASALKFQSLVDTIGTRVTFSVGVSTISNADSSREIRSTDNVVIQIVPGPPLYIKSVTGRIKPTTIAIGTGARGFDLGDASQRFQGQISFDSVQIALGFQSSAGFPTDYDLQLIAMNRRQSPPKVDSLVVPPPQGSTQRRLFPSNNQATRIVLDNSSGLNTFLSKFFPSFPDTFIVRGTMTVNPPDVFATPLGKGTIYDTSNVYSSVDLWFPIRLGISNASVWDTVDIGVKEHFPRDFAASSQQGIIYFDVDNGMPLSFSFRAALLRRGTAGVLDTLLYIPTDGSRLIDAAAVNGSGVVTSSAISRFSITLVGSDLQQFGSADLMWIDLHVTTSNGGAIVNVQDTQMIKIRASANLVYRIGER